MATGIKRPPVLPYSPLALLEFPIRLFNPPPAPCKVRTFQIAPNFEVDLDDVLDNKHLPPLSLKDLETYLLFTEYSAENLYFILWLRDYTRRHKAYTANDPSQPRVSSGELAVKYSRALRTFFDPKAQLCLNLPEQSSAMIRSLGSTSSFPDPRIFDDVEIQVKAMLKDSLARLVRMSTGNAGKGRAWFSAGTAVGGILAGLVLIFATGFMGISRWARIGAFPCFWIGIAGLIAAPHGMCLIMYSFGDTRQLYSYEVAAPEIPDNILLTDMLDKEEQEIGYTGSEWSHGSTAYLTASFIQSPPYPGSVPPTAKEFKFDFDALPPTPRASSGSVRDSTLSSSPTFAGMVRVLNPVIRRSQWEIATKSLLIGFIVSLLLTAGSIALPFHHRS